jgi:hypothetical protein
MNGEDKSVLQEIIERTKKILSDEPEVVKGLFEIGMQPFIRMVTKRDNKKGIELMNELYLLRHEINKYIDNNKLEPECDNTSYGYQYGIEVFPATGTGTYPVSDTNTCSHTTTNTCPLCRPKKQSTTAGASK